MISDDTFPNKDQLRSKKDNFGPNQILFQTALKSPSPKHVVIASIFISVILVSNPSCKILIVL